MRRDADGEYCTAEGLHIHKCKRCRSTWSHPVPDDDVSYIRAHTCPKCGKEEYWKCELKEVPVIDFPWPGHWTEDLKKTSEEVKKAEDSDDGW